LLIATDMSFSDSNQEACNRRATMSGESSSRSIDNGDPYLALNSLPSDLDTVIKSSTELLLS
jgi:hypothetical protein